MRGVIISGGLGTRLKPVTNFINKHLLPVYDKIMAEYPLETLVNAGIKDIIIVTGETNAGTMVNYFRDGSEFGCRIVYGFQPGGNGGISHALSMAEEFCKGHKIAAILGDNYFEEDITQYVKDFEKKEKGAMDILHEIQDLKTLQRLGVAQFNKKNELVGILEKPKNPPSNFVQTGLYMYDSRVFDFIRKLRPSARGELEITDLNNIYIKEGTMDYRVTKKKWIDMGTFDSILDASIYIRDKKRISSK